MIYCGIKKILVLPILLVLSQLAGQSSLVDGLIAYYPLDGDALDISGYCNHGQVNGPRAGHGVSGEFLTAMTFDGVDDFIEIPNSEMFDFDENQDFAVSFWVKVADQQMDVDTSDNDIISNQKSKHHDHIYAAQFDGYRSGCRGATSLQTKLGTKDQNFKHILLNVGGGKFYFYIDGKLKRRKGSNVFCSAKNDAPIRFGKRGGSEFQNHFTGSLDNVAFYNRALTEDEISRLSSPETDLSDQLINSVNTSYRVTADTLYFDDDVFHLNAGQRIQLSSLTKYLEIGSQYHVVINGHTNGIPPHEFCDVLSLKRAKVIEQYLFDLGISCSKISSVGHGKRDPIAPNNPYSQRKRNQRAEIVLYKLSKV